MHCLVHYPDRDQLLVIGSSCTLSVLARDEQLGAWHTASKMKFATGTGEAATGLQVRGGGCLGLRGRYGPRKGEGHGLCLPGVYATCILKGAGALGGSAGRSTPMPGTVLHCLQQL